MLHPENQSSVCLLTPSPSDVNMESPSPVSNYGKYDYSEQMSSGSKFGLTNGPSTFIHVETVDKEQEEMKSFYAERISNEENSKRSAAMTMGYPGQAVQIIASQKGSSVVHVEKVSMETNESVPEVKATEEPVASVKIQITKEGIKVISDKETTV
ncbi:hypothetical protein C0J52_24094 [Blattella germanica]|nr:hypothetical protein C0J52_24094 [Blattella germanica]